MIHNWLKCAMLGERHDKIVVVNGPQASGKSTFVRMLGELTIQDTITTTENIQNSTFRNLNYVSCDYDIVAFDEVSLSEEFIDSVYKNLYAEEVKYESKGVGKVSGKPRANFILLTNYVTVPADDRYIVVPPLVAINQLLDKLS